MTLLLELFTIHVEDDHHRDRIYRNSFVRSFFQDRFF